MFCGVNVWQIAKLKVIGKIKFKFGKLRTTRKIRQTFLLPNIPAIQYSLLYIAIYLAFTFGVSQVQVRVENPEKTYQKIVLVM